MHLLVALRGQPDKIRNWMSDWEAQYFQYKVNDTSLIEGSVEDKKKIAKGIKAGNTFQLQTIVRPLQFVELVFPETSKDEVLRTICRTNEYVKTNPINKMAAVLRTGLRLKKLPTFEEKGQIRIIRKGVSAYPIGVKEDKTSDSGEYI